MKSNIRKLRAEKNISQTTLANVLGKTQQTVSHMEKDRDRIPIESLITLADYFGVTTDYILGVEAEGRPKEKGVRRTDTDTDTLNAAGIPNPVTFRTEKDYQNNFVTENQQRLYQLMVSLLLYFLEDDAMALSVPRESGYEH